MRPTLLLLVVACSSEPPVRNGTAELAAALEIFNGPDVVRQRQHAFELVAQACELGNRHGCEVIVDGASPHITAPMRDMAMDHLRITCRGGDLVSCRLLATSGLATRSEPRQIQLGCDAGYEYDCFTLEGEEQDPTAHAALVKKLLDAAAVRCGYGVVNACVYDQRSQSPENRRRFRFACAVDDSYCPQYDQLRARRQ